MFNLPKELINLVYEFDFTKRENFDKVIQEFKIRRDNNWENYCWYGIGCHPEEVEDEFSWNYRRDGTFEMIYLQGFYKTESNLNQKIKDFIIDFYIEKYGYNLDDNIFKKWNKKYNYKYIYN